MLKALSLNLAIALTVASALGSGEASASALQSRKTASSKEQAIVSEKVDVNTAGAAALESLPQISPESAAKIVAHRPYRSYDDLETKAGLSARTMTAIKGRIVFGAPAASVSTRKPSAKAVKPSMEPSASPKTVKKVDINTADADELATLPGIGAAMAQAIIDERPFGTFDDLEEVKGLGPAKLARLKDLVVVGSTTREITIPRSEMPLETGRSVAAKSKPFSKKATLAPGVRINLNLATLDELATLPGIGPVKAQAIIDGRPYSRPEDVMNVSGIKGATFDRIKDHVSVE
jgi:competence protein ComEA